MTNQVIICPYCQKEIPLTEALSHQIKEDLRKEFDTEVKKKEQDHAQIYQPPYIIIAETALWKRRRKSKSLFRNKCMACDYI